MSTEVYSVVTDDRRSGIAVKVFSNYKKARAWVGEMLEMYLSNGDGPPSKSVKLGSLEQGVETWYFGEGDSIELRKQPLL